MELKARGGAGLWQDPGILLALHQEGSTGVCLVTGGFAAGSGEVRE